jgi:hypothetical protein
LPDLTFLFPLQESKIFARGSAVRNLGGDANKSKIAIICTPVSPNCKRFLEFSCFKGHRDKASNIDVRMNAVPKVKRADHRGNVLGRAADQAEWTCDGDPTRSMSGLQ